LARDFQIAVLVPVAAGIPLVLLELIALALTLLQ